MMTNEHFFSAVLIVVLLCTGCLGEGEDSWKHYSSGGMYVTSSPSMSPDGAMIVFSSPRTGNGDIYKIQRDGSNRIRLTDSPAFEADPVFSPDGKTIAFVREANGCRHIWRMDKDGANQKQLTFGRVLDDICLFSPDGSTLLFSRSPLSMSSGKVTTPHAFDLSKKTVQKLEGLRDYCYSPDGKRIAHSIINQENRRYEVRIMDADGSNKRFLAAGCLPRFSPDGRILYSLFPGRDNSPGSTWMITDTNEKNPREIGRWDRPVFTADGKHIVCFSPEYRSQVLKMDLDGSNRKLLKVPGGNAKELRPCRDGFIFRLVHGDDRVGDIWVINTKKWTVHLVAPMR